MDFLKWGHLPLHPSAVLYYPGEMFNLCESKLSRRGRNGAIGLYTWLGGCGPCETRVQCTGHSMTASLSSSPAETGPHLPLPWSLQSSPFLQDTFLWEKLPGRLWAEVAQEKAPSLEVQIHPPTSGT